MEWKQKVPKIKFNKKDNVIKKLCNINGVSNIGSFLEPKASESLYDNYLLKNMDAARNLVLQAIYKEQSISIFSDVDADGISSTAIMYNYLKQVTPNVKWFYSQRSSGHGISNGLDFVPEGTELLIIVDSSTNETDACEELKKRGIENIVILDHHIVEKHNPYAVIVNPQQEGDEYPNKEISGAGLCWKFCQVLDDNLGSDYSEELVDLAGVGLVSDVMCMKEIENRYIVHAALDNIENLGIKALCKTNTYLNMFDLSAKDIAFSITPLLNAASRMDKIQLAIELLTTDDEFRALELATELSELNESRKKMQAQYVDKFTLLINPDDKIILITDSKIGKTFAGLVAGEFANMYQKPCAVLREKPNIKTLDGSFRAFGSHKLKSLFESLPINYTVMAGHEGAGGISIWKQDLELLRRQANEALKGVVLEQTYYYDLEIDSNQITEELLYDIKEFNRITGKNMPEARFLVKNLFPEKITPMKNKATFKATCSNGVVLMKFRTNQQFIKEFPLLQPMEAIGGLSLNSYRDFKKREIKTTQVLIEDYRTI